MLPQKEKSSSRYPPKPRLALNVCITGHRPDRLPEDSGPLAEKIFETLELIAQVFAEIAASDPARESHDLHETPALRLLSPLAEGADRMAVESALTISVPCKLPGIPEIRYELQCPLPFPVAEYRKDFESRENHPEDTRLAFDALLQRIQGHPAHRVLELDGTRQTEGAKNLAYWKVGRFVLRHSDLLMAVWDGEEDKTSVGTAGVVAKAERDRVPTVLVHPKAPHPVEFRDYNELTENKWVSLTGRLLLQRMQRLLLPPDLLPKPSMEEGESRRSGCTQVDERATILPDREAVHCVEENIRLAYFAHGNPKLTAVAKSYRLFFGLFGKHSLRGVGDGYERGAEYQWQVIVGALPNLPSDPAAVASVEAELQDRLREHFLWADRLATYYADEYRGTFTLMFSLASLAVLLALLSGPFGLFEEIFGPEVAKFLPGLAVGELIVILLILCFWGRSHWCQFHERWLDFRLLAELLRQRAFLLPIGGTATLDMPDYEADNDRSYGWVKWMVRAVGRAEGLPAVPAGGFDGPYRRGYGRYLAELLRDQASYHKHNAKRNENIAEAIHLFDLLLMMLIILACIVHIAVHIAEHALSLHYSGLADLAVIAGAALPAFGATAHGLFSHGEFKRIAGRSEGMWQRLESIANALSPKATLPPSAQPDKADAYLSATRLESLADQSVDIMSQELSDWRVIFRAKPLEPSL